MKPILFVLVASLFLGACAHPGSRRVPSLAGVPIEDRIVALAECGRAMQIPTPVINGLPFGDQGAMVLGDSTIYEHFPEDGENSILLIQGQNLHRISFQALGVYAPGGAQVTDTLELRMDGVTYYLLKDVVGSIGTAFDAQKRALNPRSIEQHFDEPAFVWYTKKQKARTGRGYLEAELLRYARDETLLQKSYDAIDSAGCERLPELDLTRLEWKARVQKAADRINRTRR